MLNSLTDQIRALSSGTIASLIGCNRYTVIDQVHASFIAWSQTDMRWLKPTTWVEAWPSFVYDAKKAHSLPNGVSQEKLLFPSYEAQMQALYGAAAADVEAMISLAASAIEHINEDDLEQYARAPRQVVTG